MARLWLAVLTFATCGLAQTVQVYSELAEIDSSGKVTSPENPREILSPMLVRGGFTSFQIVVQVNPGTAYGLHIGQNPENAVTIKLSREMADGKLQEVELPFKADRTMAFWMNVWTSPIAPIRRIKIEPQLHIEPQPGFEEDWVQYPIEARVVPATVPESAPLAQSGLHGDHADEILRDGLCGHGLGTISHTNPVSISEARWRNSMQDVALAQMALKARPAIKDDLVKTLGSCTAPPFHEREQYLPIRDYLFRLP